MFIEIILCDEAMRILPINNFDPASDFCLLFTEFLAYDLHLISIEHLTYVEPMGVGRFVRSIPTITSIKG